MVQFSGGFCGETKSIQILQSRVGPGVRYMIKNDRSFSDSARKQKIIRIDKEERFL